MTVNDKNTYILIQDTNNEYYKMPLETLGNIIVMANDTNDKVENLIDTIDTLSAYILNLSVEFIQEHYSLEELSEQFELLSETNALLTDNSILGEEDLDKYVLDRKIILKDVLDDVYDKEYDDAGNVFDKIISETDSVYE